MQRDDAVNGAVKLQTLPKQATCGVVDVAYGRRLSSIASSCSTFGRGMHDRRNRIQSMRRKEKANPHLPLAVSSPAPVEEEEPFAGRLHTPVHPSCRTTRV